MLSLGLTLIAAGLLLAALETHTPTYGVLGGAGLLGALAGAGLVIAAGADWGWPLAAAGLLAALGLAVAVFKSAAAQRRRPQVGELVGRHGVAQERLAPSGWVLLDGARWQATADRDVAAGAEVEVVAVDGLTLAVRAA